MGAVSEVSFEPGCTILPGVVICGPGGVVVRKPGKCSGLCGKDEARRIVRYPNSAYYGPTVLCECGDGWSDGFLHERPFLRGWRKREQERFEKDWADALPEGAEALYGMDPDGDNFAWLYAVRLPDGTEVGR